MKKLYRNLWCIDKILKYKYPYYLEYKDDIMNIISLYGGESNDDIIFQYFSYKSKEDIYSLVINFLEMLDDSYLEKFLQADILMYTKEEIQELLEDDLIDKFTACRLKRVLVSDGIVYIKTTNGKYYISILIENNIKDAFKLLHEFIHTVSHSDSILREIQAILSEIIFSNYLRDVGINDKEIDDYWNCRISQLAPNGNFIDIYFTLKMLDLYYDKSITMDNLGLDKKSYDKIIKNYENSSNIVKFIDSIKNVDLEHILGFYKALMIFNSTSKEEMYSTFKELNGVGLWLEGKEFNNYIEMVINDNNSKVKRK